MLLDFFLPIISFGLKALIVIILICLPLLLIGALIAGRRGSGSKPKYTIKVTDIKHELRHRRKFMHRAIERSLPDFDEKAYNKQKKSEKKSKQAHKEERLKQEQDKIKALRDQGHFCPRNLFVIKFNGDIQASQVRDLRREIDAILEAATKEDEVIICLTSPGGMVNTYGLCASQLLRLRDRGIYLTCVVDCMAASGGYLMACTANHIAAAPFAYIGSIGVVTALPNFKKLLDKHDIAYEQVTAGKYKRTLTMFGENNDEARAKVKEELEAIHKRFKEQVSRYRPQINMDEVATGEAWLAQDALKLGLIDEISTSEEYIYKRCAVTSGAAVRLRVVRRRRRGLIARLNRMFKAQLPAAALRRDVIAELEGDRWSRIR